MDSILIDFIVIEYGVCAFCAAPYFFLRSGSDVHSCFVQCILLYRSAKE